MSEITAKERNELAALAGVDKDYLYQCMSGRRDMDAPKAAEVERATGNRIRRWHLRRDWHLVWPELIGVTGAPRVPRAPKRVRVPA